MYEGIFMTEEKSLISFAILSTEWHEERKDYLDLFIPFFLQCIDQQRNSSSVISLKKIKERLKEEFGINLLSNVVEMIARKVAHEGYITIKNNICYRTDKVIDTKIFVDKREMAERHQKELFQGIASYLEEEYPSFKFEKNVLEDVFIQYLCKYGRGIVVSSFENKDLEEIDQEQLYKYYIGKFIAYVKVNNKTYFKYIQEIVYGAMYATALFMQENVRNIQVKSKIQNLKVFLDTPLLLYVLGYSGEEFQESVSELISILKSLGVEIGYWQHNIDELRSILDAYERHYDQGTLEQSRNFEYFLMNRITPLDISRFKATLNTDLDKMGIFLQEDVEISQEEMVDRDLFEKYLKENMLYRSGDRRMNDVNSICYTYKLRSRKDFRRIENCEYLFVTQNHTLALLAKKYFNENRSKDEYPAIIDDTLLTSIVWIKSETDGEKILNSKIIADAWAAQNVPESFWEKCVEEIQKLMEHGDINQEQVYLLQYDIFARKQLYEKTDGDVEKLNMCDINGVLKQVEYYKHQEILDEKNKWEEKSKQATEENSQLITKLIESKAIQYKQCGGMWKIIAILRKCLVLLLCVGLVGISQLISIIQNQHHNLLWGFGAIIVTIILKFLDKLIFGKKKFFSDFLLDKSKKMLKDKIAKSEDRFVDEIVEGVIEKSKLF